MMHGTMNLKFISEYVVMMHTFQNFLLFHLERSTVTVLQISSHAVVFFIIY
jgi:hypothetical protein